MEVYNENGIIDYVSDGFLDCLRIIEPRVVNWPDFQGASANYFICFPYAEEYQKQLNVIQDKVSQIQTVNDFIDSGFIKLLKTGKYEFTLCNDSHLNLQFNFTLHNSNEYIFKKLKQKEENGRFPFACYLNGFYPDNKQLMFTQPIETIDKKRVNHYEKLIVAGDRPAAIVMQGDEIKYILDGHEKLLAYDNLNIKPPFILINNVGQIGKNHEPISILPEIQKHLLKCQIDHILAFGLESIDTRSRIYTNLVDNHLNRSSHLHEYMLMGLLGNIKSYTTAIKNGSNLKNFEENLKWLEERIATIKLRLQNNRQFYLIKTSDKSEILIKSWEKIESLFKS